MKARVKATGEIVEVIAVGDYINENGQIIGDYKDANGILYTSYDLDFYIEEGIVIPDYWTRLEHQAAIAAMQGLCANAKFMQDHEGDFQCHEEMIAEYAKDIAHALVEKLKKESK